MRKFKRFIPWLLVLFFPSLGFIYMIASDGLKSIIEVLKYSAILGIPVGLLMGAIAAAVQRSIKLGIWISLGSVFGCILVSCGLAGYFIAPFLIVNLLKWIGLARQGSGLGNSSDSFGGSSEGLEEAVFPCFLILFIPLAISGGGMGALLYYDRHRPRE